MHLQNRHENRTKFLHMRTYFMCELEFHIHKTFIQKRSEKNMNSVNNIKLNLHFDLEKIQRRATTTHP